MQTLTLTTLIFVVLTGSPRFSVRDAASKRLELLADYAPSIILAGESSADAEIATRCRTVMNHWYQRHAAEIVDRLQPAIGWPWCDSLTMNCMDANGTLMELEWDRRDWNLHDRQPFLALAQQQGYPPGHPWNAYREATRLWLIELVAQRRDAAYFLRCLCEGHLQQCRHYGYGPRYGLPAPTDLIAAAKQLRAP
jgi:hypothetical protein